MGQEEVLFYDLFVNLDHWHLEGSKTVSISEPGTMRLACIGSKQGSVGCHAFCREDFPDGIAVEYDLLVHERNGLVITFVAMRGLNGEDMIEDLPAREGVFRDYVGEDALLRSYHTSISRYNDKGEHTGVSNWRRNPGLHLVGQGEDLCEEIGRRYEIRVEKEGGRCAQFVDGKAGPAFTDPDELPDEIPSLGKVGFRAIGSPVLARDMRTTPNGACPTRWRRRRRRVFERATFWGAWAARNLLFFCRKPTGRARLKRLRSCAATFLRFALSSGAGPSASQRALVSARSI